jgi:anti-anti-sigma factor
MNFSAQLQGATGMVLLEGRFTFECHQAFKNVTDPLLDNPALAEIRLDLAGVSYMDSSSLGMLLVLREKAEAKGRVIVLVRPSPSVITILKVVQFGKIFQILA